MFRLSYSAKSDIKGHIKFKSLPRLGPNTDTDGNIWDVHAIIGTRVNAVLQEDLHPYFTDTSSNPSYGLVQQTWEPYTYEVERI